MKKSNLFTVAIVLLALTQSCFDPFMGDICISGVGTIVSEEITLDPITAISSETVVDVEIIQGAEQKVVVEGHENMIDELDLEVIKGELKIHMRGNCYNRFTMKVQITIPDLKSVEVKSTGDVTLGEFTNLADLELKITNTGDIIGTGTIEVAGLTEIASKSTGNIELELTTSELEVELTGTGDIELLGSCLNQTIETSGTGDYDAFDFESEVCDVESNGVGDVKVLVTDKLDAVIKSVGDVYVKGDPKVTVYDNSVGDLINIDK